MWHFKSNACPFRSAIIAFLNLKCALSHDDYSTISYLQNKNNLKHKVPNTRISENRDSMHKNCQRSLFPSSKTSQKRFIPLDKQARLARLLLVPCFFTNSKRLSWWVGKKILFVGGLAIQLHLISLRRNRLERILQNEKRSIQRNYVFQVQNIPLTRH